MEQPCEMPRQPLTVAVHGVVRWRRVDLRRLITKRFGVVYHERTVGEILHQLGFRCISARAIRRRTSGSWPSSKTYGPRARALLVLVIVERQPWSAFPEPSLDVGRG